MSAINETFGKQLPHGHPGNHPNVHKIVEILLERLIGPIERSAKKRFHQIEELNALSDRNLFELGLRRSDITSYVMRDLDEE